MSTTASILPADQRRRSRGGRPVVRDDARLDARVSAACSLEQAAQIKAAAASCGLTKSEYLLRAALGVRIAAPVVPGEWRFVWTALAPLASNLNVLVRHLSTAAVIREVADSSVFDQLRQIVPELAHQLSQLREALIPPR